MIYLKEDIPVKLPGRSSIRITFNYSQNIVDAVKQLPSAIWHKKLNCWEIPITSLAQAINILSNYDDIDFELLPDIAKNEHKIKIDTSTYKTQPYEYQKDGIEYGLNNPEFLLLDAPGLGKTLQIIYLAQELKERENLEHCLIICGVNALKHNWKREIEKHSTLSAKILGERQLRNGKMKIGSVADRVAHLKQPIDEFFIITNIESLRSTDVVNAIKSGKNKIDMIAVDEVHHCKSPNAQQTKGLRKLDAKHKIAMSGTLLTNSPLDAYVPLTWIGVDNSTFTNYKYYYCTYTGPFNNILIGYKNTEVLKDQIASCSLRRDKSLLDLPPKTVIQEYVTMDDEQAKFYDNIVNGVVEQIDKVEINTSFILSMSIRLRQATANPQTLTTENISSAKIQRAIELAQEITSNGDKVIIFSVFKDGLSKICSELSELNPLLCTGDIDDNTISNNVDLFQNNPEYKVLCATSQKLGTGVTLTAASYAIFLDTPWTAADFQQAQDRIYRIGSDKPVFIYELITQDTIDERVHEIVYDKEAISDFIIDNKISRTGLDSLKKYILDLK